MIQPISSHEPTAVPQNTSQHEKQRLFQISFETAVLSTYVAVSGKNGSLKHQLDQLEKGIKKGKDPTKLAQDLNQIIDQINQSEKGKANFPPFHFIEDRETQALASHVISFEKYIHLLAEKKVVSWDQEEPLFANASQLFHRINTGSFPTSKQGFSEFQQLINQFNGKVPFEHRYPNVPEALL